MSRNPSAWMVLKFGGTSVSSLANWTNIARVAAERCSEGARVLIVHSALSGITDRLERLLDAAIAQAPEEELRHIEERHQRLAAELRVTPPVEVERQLAELREIAAGVALVGEVPHHIRDGADHAFQVGASGVHIFFVISGFVMVYTASDLN